MSPAEITSRLAALRRAGERLRRRPAAETLDALCRVLDAWSDPESAWRQELLDCLPEATGFSRENVREGLARALLHWNGDALRALALAELGGEDAQGFPCSAVLLAGSIPMPTLVAMLAPLVLRSPVFAKCASRDPVTAPLVARSIAAVDPELGSCVEVASLSGSDAAAMGALLAAECVVATGSDETIAAVAARVTPSQRLVRRGHRLSLAALGDAATRGDALAETAAALSLDVALWDQLGCLSPIAVFVASRDADAADRVAAALATALERAEERWPRGRVEARDAALLAHERAEAELREAAGRRVCLFSGAEQAWTVVREEDARPRTAPLHRFVRVLPIEDEDALLTAIEPLSAHIAGVAIAGFEPQSLMAEVLVRRGASRVCAPGCLQAPPLDWRNDPRGVISPLARDRAG